MRLLNIITGISVSLLVSLLCNRAKPAQVVELDICLAIEWIRVCIDLCIKPRMTAASPYLYQEHDQP